MILNTLRKLCNHRSVAQVLLNRSSRALEGTQNDHLISLNFKGHLKVLQIATEQVAYGKHLQRNSHKNVHESSRDELQILRLILILISMRFMRLALVELLGKYV